MPFIDSQLSRAILQFGLEQSMHIALIFVIIACISRAAGKSKILFQYGLWALVLLRCILPLDFSSEYSLYTLFFNQNSDILADNSIGLTDFLNPDATDALLPYTEIETSHPSFHAAGILTLFWAAGLLLFLLLRCRQFLQFYRIKYHAHSNTNPHLSALVEHWQNKLKIRRSVSLLFTSSLCPPFTMGVFKPVIILPDSILTAMNHRSIESMIAHELIHIKHGDALWIQLQNVIQCLFFFHPAVWIANKKINFYRECLCDGSVVSRGTIPRQTYGQSLLNSLQLSQRGPDWQSTAAGFVFSKNMLTDRIQNLKGGQKMNIRNGIISILILMGLACVLLPMAATTQADPAKQSLNQDLVSSIDFTNPIQDKYHISSPYGKKISYQGKTATHQGIDLAAQSGTPVYAAGKGHVAMPRTQPGYGKNILIDHGGKTKSFYAHLDSVMVEPGQRVRKGQLIGLVGSTGRSTGPHLHFELIENGQRIDPAAKIQF